MRYAYENELYHDGILGQKWGRKQGPPYPLDPGDHSASEKKAGYTKSISKGEGNSSHKSKSKNADSSEKKSGTGKKVAIGAGAAGVAGAGAAIAGHAAAAGAAASTAAATAATAVHTAAVLKTVGTIALTAAAVGGAAYAGRKYLERAENRKIAYDRYLRSSNRNYKILNSWHEYAKRTADSPRYDSDQSAHPNVKKMKTSELLRRASIRKVKR